MNKKKGTGGRKREREVRRFWFSYFLYEILTKTKKHKKKAIQLDVKNIVVLIDSDDDEDLFWGLA